MSNATRYKTYLFYDCEITFNLIQNYLKVINYLFFYHLIYDTHSNKERYITNNKNIKFSNNNNCIFFQHIHNFK